MKRSGMNLMMAALFCCALIMTTMTATANDQKIMGKNKQKTVTFQEDVLVNDTLVKKGTYQVRFDAANNQITVMDNDGDVIAKAKANVKLQDQKAPHNSIASTQTAKGKMMVSLTFAGDKRVIMLEDTASNASEE